MHPEIQKLIEIAKKDRQFSETDRKIILEKAKSLGFSKTEIHNLDFELWDILLDFNRQKNKVFETTCPNCGATVMSNDITCSFCDFVLIDKNKSIEIDSFLIDAEEEMADLIKISSIGIFDTSIITSFFISILFLYISTNLGKNNVKIYFLLLLLIGFQAFLIFKRTNTIKFISKYFSLKKKFTIKLNDFIKVHSNNNQLLNIKQKFEIRIKKNFKNTIKRFIISGSIGIVIFIAVFRIAYPGALYTPTRFEPKTINFKIKNSEIVCPKDLALNFNLITDNFSIVTRKEYLPESIYFKTTDLDIELNPNIFAYKDRINYLYFRLYLLDKKKKNITEPLEFSIKFNKLIHAVKTTNGKKIYTIQLEFFIIDYNSDIMLKKYYTLVRELKKSKHVNVKLEILTYE